MKTVWIVRWRGFDEELPSPQEALDRWERLAAAGIPAELFKVRGGRPAGAGPLVAALAAPDGAGAAGRD